MESPVGAPSSTPPRDSKKAWVLCTAVRPVGTNNSKRPIPNPKAQGSDPLVHRGELQHMAAELGSYKQAHSQPYQPPLTLGQLQSSGGSSPSQGAGFQSPSYAWRDWVVEAPCHDCYPNHIAPAPHGPSCGWDISIKHWAVPAASLPTAKKNCDEMVVAERDHGHDASSLHSTKSGGSRLSSTSYAAIRARAKLEAARARASYRQREAELKVKEAQIAAELSTLEHEKDIAAALAETQFLEEAAEL
ncbi:hypothetical protein L3Q82_002951 [Scortum barcoo]|uniref:Uncharacterized protein n=1 Tax=Scortum barcoo TaxID=214431 RepID=A0ACB8VR28_9TELE|nr:hypothetical protein L3Q82_002951 [Scortum barcoo]